MNHIINNPLILLLIIFWVLPWKGVALWRSARNGQKWWFIVLLVFNTLAILPIIYIFYFSEKKKVESRDELE
ncbi:MAG TPA: hypothetical protein ENL27_01910 [Candidatus Parcubacteria bacterium]|nr:hypothetical protein [Candidatus Parcubacteria bacterium]